MDFVILADHQVKIKKKLKDWQILGSCQWVKKKAVEHDINSNNNDIWCICNSPQRPKKREERNWRSEEESRPSKSQCREEENLVFWFDAQIYFNT